jgi:glycosyltransferase involved in cell wall biosynthesis
MRIAQIILPGVSAYERKSQRADLVSLSAQHEVVVVTPGEARTSGAQVAHVYASGELPASEFVRFPLPYVASADVRRSRWTWRKPVGPRVIVTPENLPEVVEDAYFAAPSQRTGGEDKIVGSFARRATLQMVDLTRSRISRFRDDVQWRTFSVQPAPEDLASVDLWVDPAVDESDLDGFVAEALVVGLPVVAARWPVNSQRLEQGRTGMLVPPRDPNEMTHAILAALFRSEVATSKISAARQTVSKFRARHRLRVLNGMYETLIQQ